MDVYKDAVFVFTQKPAIKQHCAPDMTMAQQQL